MKAKWLVVGLACVGGSPALAQNSVTLYGVLDAYAGLTHATGHGTVVSLDSAGFQQSRYGLRVVEDVGGGVHINAVLENGFSLTNGTAADSTQAFSRQAWIGVSGAAGEFRAGRQNSPQYIMLSQIDAFSGATYGSAINNSSSLVTRYNNALTYMSPSLGGLRIQGLFSLGGQTSPSTGNNAYVAMVEYSKGPWYLGINHAEQKSQNAVFTVKSTFAVTNYDYGAGKIYVSYYRGDNPGANASANIEGKYTSIYSLSGDWRLTPALTIGADCGWIQQSGNDAPRAWQASLISTYALSKRTLLYGTVAHVSNGNDGVFSLGGAGPIVRNVPSSSGSETGFQVGIRELF
jgi:predicted porin